MRYTPTIYYIGDFEQMPLLEYYYSGVSAEITDIIIGFSIGTL